MPLKITDHFIYRRPEDLVFESPDALRAHLKGLGATRREVAYPHCVYRFMNREDGVYLLPQDRDIGHKEFKLSDWAFGQICTDLRLPRNTMRRLNYRLITDIFNHLCISQYPAKRVLLVDKKEDCEQLTAVYSYRYYRVPDLTILNKVVSSAIHMEPHQISWCLRNMHLIYRSLEDPIQIGEFGQFRKALVIVNSEVCSCGFYYIQGLIEEEKGYLLLLDPTKSAVRYRHTVSLAKFVEDLPESIAKFSETVDADEKAKAALETPFLTYSDINRVQDDDDLNLVANKLKKIGVSLPESRALSLMISDKPSVFEVINTAASRISAKYTDSRIEQLSALAAII